MIKVSANASPAAAAKPVESRPGASTERAHAAEQAPSATEVKAAARQIEAYMRSLGRALEFRVDDATGRTVVTVRDSSTGDVVRQIPTEEVLRIAQSLAAHSPQPKGSVLLDLTA
jgi:flagellar protein FlaG